MAGEKTIEKKHSKGGKKGEGRHCKYCKAEIEGYPEHRAHENKCQPKSKAVPVDADVEARNRALRVRIRDQRAAKEAEANAVDEAEGAVEDVAVDDVVAEHGVVGNADEAVQGALRG